MHFDRRSEGWLVPLPFLWNVRAVAICAGRGTWLVEEHHFFTHRPLQRVAGRTGHVLMATFERKCGLLVIEERGLPLVAVVAASTLVGTRAKLIGVRVFVALDA